jgi:hypothetical protein
MKVKIDGAYTDGHEYKRVVEIEEPTDFPPDTDEKWWDEWWWKHVFDETGDNKSGKLGSYEEATIIEANDAHLLGLQHAWDS